MPNRSFTNYTKEMSVEQQNEKEKSSETKEVTSLLNKLNKNDIIENFICPSNDRKKFEVIEKKKLIKEAINLLMKRCSDSCDLLLFVHYTCVLFEERKRTWNLFEIKNGKRFSNSYVAPEKISGSLFKYLNRHSISCRIFSEKKDGFIWTVLILDDSPQVIYCAADMKSSLVFISNLIPKYSLIIYEVVRKAFKGSEIELIKSLRVKGKDIQNGKSYRPALKKKKSEAKKNTTKNKNERTHITNSSQCHIADIDPSQLQECPQSHEECDKSNDECNEMEQEVSENTTLPTMEVLKYYVSCRCISINSKGSCFVKFQGGNILKGLDKLIEYGIADPELPDHLYVEPRDGKIIHVVNLSEQE